MTLLAMNLVSLGLTGAFAAKSPARQALEQGQEALRSGNIAGARAEFEKAVRLAPNDAEAQSALGDNGRVVLRYSGTEPLARVMVEAEQDADVQRYSESLAEALRKSIGA